MFAMAKVDDEKFQEIRSEFGSILSSHHSGSPVIGSVIDMGASGKQAAALQPMLLEAQAQEEATRMQLENQQLEKISEQLQKDLAESAFRRTKRGQFRSGWSSHHIRPAVSYLLLVVLGSLPKPASLWIPLASALKKVEST